MLNKEIAAILEEIARHLKTKETSKNAAKNIDFRPYAYQRAALFLEALEQDIKKIYEHGGRSALEEIPGIGKSIALKIEEYIKTGKIKEYEKLKKETPVNFGEIVRVEGMGPKRTKTLYRKLGIKNLKDLEKAAKSRKIAPLFGFGEKTEKNILEGIKFLKRDKGRFLFADILPLAEEIIKKFKKFKQVQRISEAGSFRRKKETIGDVDILIVSKSPRKIMDFFVSFDSVDKVWSKGGTKSSTRMKQGFDVDLRVVPAKSYGAALQYFTGSKEHNIELRKNALLKGLKLNEYGLFRGPKMIAGKSEEDVYKALGLDFIPPELRENKGEIEASKNKALPRLVSLADIKGDFHCHSLWNGGKNTIEEMAQKARELGYKYIGIADHTKFLRIERGLDERQLLAQKKEIEKLNSKLASQNLNFRILQGCEANILADGSLDIKDSVLSQMDYAVAGIHSGFKIGREKMTERLIRAMENKNVNIISHPTGRLLLRRDEYQIDFEKILKTAKETKTILEINANPLRLDLKDDYIKKAKEQGVNMAINSDAHKTEQLFLMKFGVFEARRGWLEKRDIINTYNLKDLLSFFKK